MAARSKDSSVLFLATVVTNLFPVSAVFLLGWDAKTLAVVYAVELLVAVPFAGVKALFAARPPDYDELETPHEDSLLREDDHGGVSVGPSDLNRRRGSVTVVDWLPPVYPRNVSFATGWLGITLALAGPLSLAFSRYTDVVATLANPAVLGSVLSLVVSHVAVIERQYFRERRYETVTPREVVDTTVRELFVAVCVLFVGYGIGPTSGLIGLVGLKLLWEWTGYRGDGASDRSETAGVANRLPAVDVPDAAPTTELRPNGRAVVVAAFVEGLRFSAFGTPLYVFLWVSVSGDWRGGLAISLVAFVVTPSVAATVRAVQYWLTHGTLVYQCRAETLVAYDNLTETPQWATAVGDFRDATLCDGSLADRLYDTGTLSATPFAADYDRVLAHLSAPAEAVTAFELPVGTIDTGPLDRRVAAVTLVTGIVFVAVTAVGAYYVPSLVAFVSVIAVPAVTMLLGWLWGRAAPRGDGTA